MPRCLPNLTYRQSIAVRKIDALHRRFAECASYFSVTEMAQIATECEALVRAHFPEQAAKLRQERRPLAA